MERPDPGSLMAINECSTFHHSQNRPSAVAQSFERGIASELSRICAHSEEKRKKRNDFVYR